MCTGTYVRRVQARVSGSPPTCAGRQVSVSLRARDGTLPVAGPALYLLSLIKEQRRCFLWERVVPLAQGRAASVSIPHPSWPAGSRNGTRRPPGTQGHCPGAGEGLPQRKSEERSGRLVPGRAQKEQRTDGRMTEAPTSGAFEDGGRPHGGGLGTTVSRRDPSCGLRSWARTAAVLAAQSRCPSPRSYKFLRRRVILQFGSNWSRFLHLKQLIRKHPKPGAGEGRSLLAGGGQRKHFFHLGTDPSHLGRKESRQSPSPHHALRSL